MKKKMSPQSYTDGPLAGAFGDLGTLSPFVIGFIAVTKLDPLGVLFSFGLSMVIMGLYYRTPMPVQPMKVIGEKKASLSFRQAVGPGQYLDGVVNLGSGSVANL